MTSLKQGFTNLDERMRGRVVVPGHPDYDIERKIWNGVFDRRPSAIVQCHSTHDVVEAVKFARGRDLPATVRCGGHSPNGSSLADDTMAIDMRPMGAAFVDPKTRRAVVQGGAVFGPVDHEAQVHGLAFTGGTYSETGVTGLTLGGGIGWTMRKYGATVDCVTGFNVVTTEGEVIRVDDENEPELFWGMRGAGANFGIVTATEFTLHPVGPTVLAGAVAYSAEHAPAALRVWRDYMEDAPREVTTMVINTRTRPSPMLPEKAHGQMILMIAVCYTGDIAEGERALRPLREAAEPLIDFIEPTLYVTWQQFVNETLPPNPRRYEKGGYFDTVDDETLDLTIESGLAAATPEPTGPTSGLGQFAMMWMRGAIDDVADDSMAFSRKTATCWWDAFATWTDPAEDEIWRKWSRASYDALEPKAAEEAYVNLTVEGDDAFVRRAYGAEKYERLVRLKNTWDPDNFLRFNKNIAPERGRV